METELIKLNNLGIQEYNKGNFENALNYFNKALLIKEAPSIKNNIANTLNELGQKYLNEGKLEESLKKFEEASKNCEKGFENEEIYKKNYSAVKSLILNKEGIELFSKDNFNESLKKFEESYKLSPDEKFKEDIKNNMSEVYFGLYQKFMKEKNLKEADLVLDKAISTCSNNYSKKKIFLDAKNSSSFMENLILGQSNFDNKNYEIALKYFEDAEKKINDNEILKMINNNKAECYNQIGIKLYNEKKFDEALNFYSNAIKFCSNDYPKKNIFEENYNLVNNKKEEKNAINLYKEKKFEEALKIFDNILKNAKNEEEIKSINLSKALCLQNLGIKKISEKKISEGVNYLNEALQICQNDPECKKNIEDLLSKIKLDELIKKIDEYIIQRKDDEALKIIKENEVLWLYNSLDYRNIIQTKKINCLMNYGTKLMSEKKFEEGYNYINEANTLVSSDNPDKENINLMYCYSRAMMLKEKGDKLLKLNNIIEAKKLFSESEQILKDNEDKLKKMMKK